jgi:hypothetical protein
MEITQLMDLNLQLKKDSFKKTIQKIRFSYLHNLVIIYFMN